MEFSMKINQLNNVLFVEGSHKHDIICMIREVAHTSYFKRMCRACNVYAVHALHICRACKECHTSPCPYVSGTTTPTCPQLVLAHQPQLLLAADHYPVSVGTRGRSSQPLVLADCFTLKMK